jgi:PAS domain S-box-containing protein
MEWLSTFFSADGFMPHGHCFLWQPGLVWLHVVSDALISAAYATIPLTLLYFMRRRRDVPFQWVFACFGVFIIACGATHAMDIWTMWVPRYWLAGALKAVTAVASVTTAILLVRMLPKALAIPSLASMRASSEAVVASAVQFRALLESAPEAMVIVDSRGRIFLVNAQTERVFGYPRAELLGQPVEKLVPAWQTRAQLGLSGIRKDGRAIPIEISTSPIETPNGVLISSAIRDITERKQTEAKVRALLVAAQVVEAAPNAMFLIDHTHEITLVNHRAEELFGYSRDELVGQTVDQLVPARLQGRAVAAFTEPTPVPGETEPALRRELIGVRKSGAELAIEVGVSPIETPDGTFSLASVIDITERKRYEDELRRSNAELEQFAYIASHDLQEPLRMVASYTELLGQRYRGKLDDKADKYIHYAVDGAKRMQQLVADLLAYSRVGSQGKSLAPVDAAAVVRGVLHVLGAAIKDAGAVVEVGALPTVLADETQLRQLMQNLIGNALKFRGAAAPKVTIDAQLVDDRWLFRVADNGIGIDMQYAERIFEMFQRLHERGKYEGSGIGLAIAKRIVERHGGRIWIESALGAGTTFRFTLLPEPVS